jgi:ParB family transcriptional regulator, chromosome partitioning protein
MSRKIPLNTAFLKAVSADIDPIFKSTRGGPQIIEADIDRIEPNPMQPRTVFDDDALRTLAASIDRHGLQQPVGLRQIDVGRWRLVYGERRWRACKLLGRATIFAVLVEDGDDDELALIENLQRAELSPLEEAFAFQQLMTRHGHSQGQLADIVGRDRTEINRTLSLMKLPEEIRRECRELNPARYRLYRLAAEKDPARQAALWREIKAEIAGADDDGEAGAPAPPVKTGNLREGRTLLSLLRVADAVTKDATFYRGLEISASERERLTGLHRIVSDILSQ